MGGQTPSDLQQVVFVVFVFVVFVGQANTFTSSTGSIFFIFVCYLLGGQKFSHLQQVEINRICIARISVPGLVIKMPNTQVGDAHKAIQVREPYERLLSAYRSVSYSHLLCLLVSYAIWADSVRN